MLRVNVRPMTCALIGAAVVVACGAPTPPAAAPQAGALGGDQAAAPKSMVVGLSVEPATLGPFEIGGTWHQGPIYQIIHDFLVVHDNEGAPHAHLAAERPSTDRRTWTIFPDGTMETTWRLRPGVKWQDGASFRAADVVFGWNVATDRQIPWASRGVADLVDDIQTPDDYTLVLHWKTTFPFADNPDETTLDPLPIHLLEAARSADVQSFVNSGYWTRDYVGLGPYRLTGWTPGSHLELGAFDGYYLGRPKIGTITVRFMPDTNALLANILSGVVDVTTPPTNLTNLHWETLREQWADGEVVRNSFGTLSFVGPNLRIAPFGDARVRRAMTQAIDRDAVVDAQLIPRRLIADTFLIPDSDKARRLKEQVHVYQYNPAQAQALLEDAGWRRSGDDVLANDSGRHFEFQLRSTNPTQAQVIADLWKTIGLQPEIVIPAPALMASLEFQADVKGVEISGYPVTFGTWQRRVHSSAIPNPQNRYSGLNRTYYENPEVDALIDRFMVILDPGQREQVEGAIIERVTRDAVFYPLNISAQASTIRKGITGLKPVSGTPSISAFYYTTWNIVDWDRS